MTIVDDNPLAPPQQLPETLPRTSEFEAVMGSNLSVLNTRTGEYSSPQDDLNHPTGGSIQLSRDINAAT